MLHYVMYFVPSEISLATVLTAIKKTVVLRCLYIVSGVVQFKKVVLVFKVQRLQFSLLL